MGQKLAHYEIKDLIAIVTIDHPPMNALDGATKEAIGEAFMELDDRRKDIRIVILRGAGEKAFAAGADINAFLELESDFWAALTATEDMKEGARAFIEKRRPDYTGK
jgi:enoyl-CoA hydratase